MSCSLGGPGPADSDRAWDDGLELPGPSQAEIFLSYSSSGGGGGASAAHLELLASSPTTLALWLGFISPFCMCDAEVSG